MRLGKSGCLHKVVRDIAGNYFRYTSGTMWKGGSCEVFADWRQGEPNNWDYGEDCAVLGGEGGWNDLKCEPIGGFASYICGTRPCGVKGDNLALIADRFRTTGWLKLVFALLVQTPTLIFCVVMIIALGGYKDEDLNADKKGAAVVGGPVVIMQAR